MALRKEMSSAIDLQALSVGELAAVVGLIIIGVVGFYVPLPLAFFPEDPESLQIALKFRTLAVLGLAPWTVSLTIYFFVSLLFGRSGNRFPSIDPFAKSILLGTLLIACIWALIIAPRFYYLSDQRLSILELALPILSIAAFQFVFVFLALLIDRIARGYGFWLLLLGIALSGIFITTYEWSEKLSLGTVARNHLWLELALIAVSVPAACLAQQVIKDNSEIDPRFLMTSALATATLTEWLSYFAVGAASWGPELAIWFENNRTLAEIMIWLASIAVLWLAWNRHCKGQWRVLVMISFLCLALLLAIGNFSFGSGLNRILNGSDWLVAAALTLPLIDRLRAKKLRI